MAKKYVRCYVYKNRYLPPDEFVAKSMAPVEHIFDCHEWCDPEWYYNQETEDHIDNVITAKQETPVATATGPEARSSDSSDDATLFDYSGTDSEYIAVYSA